MTTNTTFRVMSGNRVIAESFYLSSALDNADAVDYHYGNARIIRVDGDTETECAGDKIDARNHERCNRSCRCL